MELQDYTSFINGKYEIADSNTAWIPLFNPNNEIEYGRAQVSDANVVNKAVNIAQEAFQSESWAGLTPNERQNLLLKFASLIERDRDQLAELDCLSAGKPRHQTSMIDAQLGADYIRYMAGWCNKIAGDVIQTSTATTESKVRNYALTLKEPVGVVAAVVPWNFPLAIATWKLAPALAAGCTVVVKAADHTPHSVLRLAELAIEAGFPKGVINVLVGDGPTTGEALVRHPLISKISFTGSTDVGVHIGSLAMQTMKKVTLELGGKAPMVVFDDVDVDQVAQATIGAAFFNGGQVCSCATRVYVHERIIDRYLDALKVNADAMVVGDSKDPATDIGPMTSKAHFEKVVSYIEKGKSEGAQMITGGVKDGAGYFIRPTVFRCESNEYSIVKEEIFGPLLSVIPFSDFEDAIAKANDTPYGLSASVWSNNFSIIEAAKSRIQAGTIWINGHNMLDVSVPFGGYKMSGIGKDLGRQALDSYLQEKSIITC